MGDSALVMPDEGVDNVGQRSLQIALERRTVPNYDVSRVVVVFDDPAAVNLLGFFAILAEALPPSGSADATECSNDNRLRA